MARPWKPLSNERMLRLGQPGPYSKRTKLMFFDHITRLDCITLFINVSLYIGEVMSAGPFRFLFYNIVRAIVEVLLLGYIPYT